MRYPNRRITCSKCGEFQIRGPAKPEYCPSCGDRVKE